MSYISDYAIALMPFKVNRSYEVWLGKQALVHEVGCAVQSEAHQSRTMRLLRRQHPTSAGYKFTFSTSLRVFAFRLTRVSVRYYYN